MIELNLGIYEGDIDVINFNNYLDLSEYILELKRFNCIWVVTGEGEYSEIVISENIDKINFLVLSEHWKELHDKKDCKFFIQEYQSFEDAYKVALDMREGHPKML